MTELSSESVAIEATFANSSNQQARRKLLLKENQSHNLNTVKGFSSKFEITLLPKNPSCKVLNISI